MKDKMKNKWWVYLNGYRVVETKSIGYKWVRYRTSKYTKYKKIKRSVWDKACIRSLEEHRWHSKVTNWANGSIHQKYDSKGNPCGASIINNMWYEFNKKYKWGRRRRSFEEVEQMYLKHLEKKRLDSRRVA